MRIARIEGHRIIEAAASHTTEILMGYIKMLLTFDDFSFLSKTTTKDGENKTIAKANLSIEDRERLHSIDELNFITNGEHLISNYEDLE